MGYYFDHINEKWEKQPPAERRYPHRRSREALLPRLIDEIERGDSEAKLYASLLARTLILHDPGLMSAFGKQVARLTDEHVRE